MTRSAQPRHRARRPRRTATIQAQATMAGLKHLTTAFERFAADHELAEAPRHDMQLALDEILSNALKHSRDGGHIVLELSITRGALQATICNDAASFNPLTAPRPATDQPLLERPIGGLGILLVTSVMDSVEYRRERRRNCLTVRRRL
jgi:serine/threonine-protein kinase RsbW